MWPFSGGEASGSGSEVLPGPPKGVNLSDEAAAQDKCPVDHETRSNWLRQQKKDEHSAESEASASALAFLSSSGSIGKTSTSQSVNVSGQKVGNALSTDRVVSSIPRLGNAGRDAVDSGGHSSAAASADPSASKHWVYPSPAQFFAAMERKNHNPQAQDMNIVVPIHNAVNERAWHQILEWERMADKDSWNACGGPQLVSFKGRPKDVTWKAWTYGLLGYQRPFDRHDWEIDRCGQRVRYVIDFYTGRTSPNDGRTSLSFYLDVRPSPASFEGMRMRLARFFTRPPPPPRSAPAASS